METRKLYYENQRTSEFEAALVACDQVDGGWEVELDASAFYPGGGGQPADRGWIAGIPVIEVAERDGAIRHRLAAQPPAGAGLPLANGSAEAARPSAAAMPAAAAPGASPAAFPLAARPGTRLRCSIDWERRFDYMQQHTGQHLISAAFAELLEIETVSIHLGESYTAVELEASSLSEKQMVAVEERVNEVIRENRAVRAHFVEREKLAAYRLRKAPPDLPVARLVEIEGFDLCACGGTHVAATGEVGLVHAVAAETIRGHVRVQWKIGRRAYLDYRESGALATAVARELGCASGMSLAALRDLRRSLAEERASASRLRRKVAELTAATLPVERLSGKRGGIELVSRRFRGESEELLREVAELLSSEPRRAICLAGEEDGLLRIRIRLDPALGVDLPGLIAPLLGLVEARGGGSNGRWQGVGKRPEGADAFIEALRGALQSSLTRSEG